jgi:hypothetical protein
VTSDQFEDSVRYLQELNTWMESFASHNQGQATLLSDIKAAIDSLSQEMKEKTPEVESEALNLPPSDHQTLNTALEDFHGEVMSRLDEISHQIEQSVPQKDDQSEFFW